MVTYSEWKKVQDAPWEPKCGHEDDMGEICLVCYTERMARTGPAFFDPEPAADLTMLELP